MTPAWRQTKCVIQVNLCRRAEFSSWTLKPPEKQAVWPEPLQAKLTAAPVRQVRSSLND